MLLPHRWRSLHCAGDCVAGPQSRLMLLSIDSPFACLADLLEERSGGERLDYFAPPPDWRQYAGVRGHCVMVTVGGLID